MNSWIKLLVPLLAIIMLMAAFTGCTDDDDDDDDDGGGGVVTTLNLSGDLEVNTKNSETNLTLEHRGGEKIVWSNYVVRLDSEILSSPTDESGSSVSESETGDTAVFSATHGDYSVGEQYTVKVIDAGTDDIVWEKSVTAKNA